MGVELGKLSVVHNFRKKRFEIQAESHVAELTYLRQGSTIIFVRTAVPPALEGQGIGSRLARAALIYAQENSLKVKCLCWFVAGYIERHPEFQPLIK